MPEPALSPDYRDLIECLTRHGVENILVGAYALAFHGYPRYTRDLDVWIARSTENARRLQAAMKEFGVPLRDEEAESLTQERHFLTFGQEPQAVDVLNFLDGCYFPTAAARAVRVDLDGLPVAILSLEDYVATKRASGRAKDRDDLRRLREVLGRLPRSRTKSD